MYAFTSRRKLAATATPCANCGAPLPVEAGAAREAGPLCPSCARPVRLGAARPDVARVSTKARPPLRVR